MALQDDPPKGNGLPKRCVPFCLSFLCFLRASTVDVQLVVSLAILGV